MNELALFAGAGGGILGGKLLGWRTVCAVECNAYAASVLCARQNDGLLPPFPVWDDVCTFDGRPWRGIVDVVSGGFPCQDISAAGKGAGIDGERSGLWGQMARIIGEVRPGTVFVENSPMLTLRGLGRVLGDLAALGYDAEWGVLGAESVGAPHKRERIWIVAHAPQYDCNAWRAEPEGQQRATGLADGRNDLADTDEKRRLRRPWLFWPGRGVEPENGGTVPDIDRHEYEGQPHARGRQGEGEEPTNLPPHAVRQRSPQPEHEWKHGRSVAECDWWTTEPDVGRVADGVAARVDRLTALGNGQVPACAAEAYRRLTLYR